MSRWGGGGLHILFVFCRIFFFEKGGGGSRVNTILSKLSLRK